MDQIMDGLYIGNYLDAQDLEALKKEGIRSILSLDGTASEVDYEETEVEIVELIDGAGNSESRFTYAVKQLARLLRQAPPVLVQCHAGRSRSPSVVASYLMWYQGASLVEAMERITDRREVLITAGLQEVFDFPLPETH